MATVTSRAATSPPLKILGMDSPWLHDVTTPLAERFDDAGGVIEIVGVMDQAHLIADLGGQGGELLVRSMKPRMALDGRLVDDQVGGGQPVDQRRVERRVGAEGQGPIAGPDAEGRRRDRVDRRPTLDRERAKRDRAA